MLEFGLGGDAPCMPNRVVERNAGSAGDTRQLGTAGA